MKGSVLMTMSSTAAMLEPQHSVAAVEAPVAVSVNGLVKSFVVTRKLWETIRHPFRIERMRALDNVSLDIRSGEFFGLLGSNGAGKTTLFKILATLVTPDEGTAAVNGHDVVRGAAQVRQVLTPVIADERSLRWRLSARENLRLYATLYGLPPSQIDARIDEVLGIVGLDSGDSKMVGRFSSGMKQRLLIGRALIPKPQILLLDEPTRSLDPVSARQLRTFLRQEVCRRLGCTVLLATHSADEAFELCDRVAILNKGRILHIGPTEALVHRFGDDRYRLWTTTPTHHALDDLVNAGLGANTLVHPIDEEGWTRIDVDVPGELMRAAEAVRFLTERGMVVARFERIRLSLGELIQRVITQEGGQVA
jgi:ABC-2 type transport system ATP-binding protein